MLRYLQNRWLKHKIIKIGRALNSHSHMHRSKGVFLTMTKISTFAAQLPLFCMRRLSNRNQLTALCLIWDSCKDSHLQLSPPLLSAGIPRPPQGELSCSGAAAEELQKNRFVVLHRRGCEVFLQPPVSLRDRRGDQTCTGSASWPTVSPDPRKSPRVRAQDSSFNDACSMYSCFHY